MTEATTDTARDYYTSEDAVEFYSTVWGGEDIHVGLYDDTKDIREASRRTVDRMAATVGDLSGKKVLDIGAGYGGGARRIASEHDAGHVTCLNIAPAENARNRKLTAEQGLEDRVSVVEGSFDDLPFEDASFDVVWSQDAILHAPDRGVVLSEVARVLKPGGDFIFTDPMQADGIGDTASLKPIYDRIHLANLASFGFYRDALKERGMDEVRIDDLSPQLRNHYAQVAEDLDAQRAELSTDDSFVDRMLEGLAHWVRGADAGKLTWGIMHFRKRG
ncbi:MAG: methyltransferase domain-containing protein [Citromicrobium sp.]|jgi:sarcosine/dimethylglycine N-methyltransferase|nr:methyltransferase domain-containing protein [Citromicrobium sp.]MBO81970.1 SAM-dependent methyltransferase [Citromicrobium sp.]|tara:strand:+ start:1514 stop:2338 length:825 start_codon:yes stop_codon:yes gene_type:complete